MTHVVFKGMMIRETEWRAIMCQSKGTRTMFYGLGICMVIFSVYFLKIFGETRFVE